MRSRRGSRVSGRPAGRSGLALTGPALAGAVPLLALALALTGCAGEQDPPLVGASEPTSSDGRSASGSGKERGSRTSLSPDEQAYADALVPQLATMSDVRATGERARCVADAAVDLLGLDAFRSVGTPREAATRFTQFYLAPFGVTPERAPQVVALFTSCGADVFTALLDDARTRFGERAETCLRDDVGRRAFEQYLARRMSEGPEFFGGGNDGSGTPEWTIWNEIVACTAPERG